MFHPQVPQLDQAPLVVACDLCEGMHLDSIARNKLPVNVKHEACISKYRNIHTSLGRRRRPAARTSRELGSSVGADETVLFFQSPKPICAYLSRCVFCTPPSHTSHLTRADQVVMNQVSTALLAALTRQRTLLDQVCSPCRS